MSSTEDQSAVRDRGTKETEEVKLVGGRCQVVGLRPSAVVGKVRRQAEMAAPSGLAAWIH